ncbi:hypothetical protein MN032_00205 [Agromyces atrinae]|uniref:hypothetical protein n=1 Tax=Agromyces atrinae TaxID=592376 RepID=UPI001F572C72|nr:hypothetical protein [Agromyces atrinae]MCI2956101.1 hypothetical protein [Agromyces atrinae]
MSTPNENTGPDAEKAEAAADALADYTEHAHDDESGDSSDTADDTASGGSPEPA